MQGLFSVQYERVGIFFLQVATLTAANVCLVFQVILLHLDWLPNDLQKSKRKKQSGKCVICSLLRDGLPGALHVLRL